MSLEGLRKALNNDPFPAENPWRPKNDEEARNWARGANLPEGFRLVEKINHYPMGVSSEAQELLDPSTGKPLAEDAAEDQVFRAKHRQRQRMTEWREEVTVYEKDYPDLEVRVEYTVAENYYGGRSHVEVLPMDNLFKERAEDDTFDCFYAPSLVYPSGRASDLERFEKENLPAIAELMRLHRVRG